MSDLTRAVFDCNVLLQALAAPDGPAGRCVQLALGRRIELVISPRVLAELTEVAARPRVATKLRLTPELVMAFITALELVAVSVDSVPEQFAYERDPDDAHYVNLALAAEAEVLRVPRQRPAGAGGRHERSRCGISIAVSRASHLRPGRVSPRVRGGTALRRVVNFD